MPFLGSTAQSASNFFTLPFRKKKQRYTINPPEESYNVIYLGNVLTIMARGENCYEKPLSLIWKAYCSRARSDLGMNLEITRSGLKAETKQQGLTEYWAHRITFSSAPPEYPKVFCWIYKHDGKRLKPELRCHAVLCKKSAEPGIINTRLQNFLHAALQEYKREKLSAQNARLTGSAGCPRRKLILQTGTLNFRPPVSRSKSAPRLGSIDEEQEEDEEQFGSDDNESVCYRAAPDVDSNSSFPVSDTYKSDAGPSSSSTTGASSVCSDDDRTTLRLPVTDPDSLSEESGYHEEGKLARESSEEIYASDNDLVILEEDYEDDEEVEQVTSL
ncbi:PID domain-containing protein [Caenorhabditis elegans]|uniref:PID domain-containing protein n=1 Tax=Caenorhabditis elegans TaxID=6239 RepID=Q20652_CAEEL|nr:PID domain-containing protein [Caenorhabditis elegans]CAA91471.1 PID domain-containing protein [Caenorhabditis elegans]|eukprot:NP_509937.1 Uncharacterized protein CELE_F52D10.2 [Caenorhabditis elegans]